MTLILCYKNPDKNAEVQEMVPNVDNFFLCEWLWVIHLFLYLYR